MPTARADQSSADFCREMGCQAGQIVTGSDDGYGEVRVRITAIGDESVLGKTVSRANHPSRQNLWSFHCRDWVSPESDAN